MLINTVVLWILSLLLSLPLVLALQDHCIRAGVVFACILDRKIIHEWTYFILEQCKYSQSLIATVLQCCISNAINTELWDTRTDIKLDAGWQPITRTKGPSTISEDKKEKECQLKQHQLDWHQSFKSHSFLKIRHFLITSQAYRSLSSTYNCKISFYCCFSILSETHKI